MCKFEFVCMCPASVAIFMPRNIMAEYIIFLSFIVSKIPKNCIWLNSVKNGKFLMFMIYILFAFVSQLK